MNVHVTRVTYCATLTKPQMKLILDAEHSKNYALENRTLCERLDDIGAIDPDYDGMYGAHVWFTLEGKRHTRKLARCVKVIANYVSELRQVSLSTKTVG